MHGAWLTIAMWVFRRWNTSYATILREIFTWAVSAILIIKFLSCLFFEWQVLTNFSCHAHLLIWTVAHNSEFAHASIKSYHIILLDLWRKSICANWSSSRYSTDSTLGSRISTLNEVVILIYIWETNVLLIFIVLRWIDLLMIDWTVSVFGASLHN